MSQLIRFFVVDFRRALVYNNNIKTREEVITMKKNRNKLSFRRKMEKFFDNYVTLDNIGELIASIICLFGIIALLSFVPALFH